VGKCLKSEFYLQEKFKCFNPFIFLMLRVTARKMSGKAKVRFKAKLNSPAEYYSRPRFVDLPKGFSSSGRLNCEHIAFGRLMRTPYLWKDDGQTLYVGTLPNYVGSKGSAIVNWIPEERELELVSLWVPFLKRIRGNGGWITDEVIDLAKRRNALKVRATTSDSPEFFPMRQILERRGFQIAMRYPRIHSLIYEKSMDQ